MFQDKNEKDIFLDGIDSYYKLKKAYDEKIKSLTNKISRNTSISLKDRKKQLEDLKKKYKCINCNNGPGGTIFKRISNEESGVILTAKCGVVRDPCPLNINIVLGLTYRYDNSIKITNDIIEKTKLEIIKSKNDRLFGYISDEEAIQIFNDNKELLTEYINCNESFIYKWLNIIEKRIKYSESKNLKNDFLNKITENLKNDTITNIIEKLKKEILSDIVIIKNYIKEFNRTGNNEKVNEAVKLYVNNLREKNKQLLNLDYMYSETYFNPDDKTCHLVQNKYTIDSIEYNNNYGVKSYNTRTGEERKINKKTFMNNNNEAKCTNKSQIRKVRTKPTENPLTELKTELNLNKDLSREQKIRIITNPPIDCKTMKHNNKTFYVFDDSICIGGTKQRLLGRALEKIGKNEIVYAGPESGFAQIALAYCTFLYGKTGTAFLNSHSSKEKNILTKIAEVFKLNVHNSEGSKPWTLRESEEAAKEYVNQDLVNRYLLPFGLKDEKGSLLYTSFYEALREAIEPKYLNNPPKRLWVTAGSGFLLNILHAIWPTTEYLIIQVGKEVTDEQISHISKKKKYISPQNFAENATRLPPYNSVPWYDAKLWQFFVVDGQEGDYIWNVGGVTNESLNNAKKMYEEIMDSGLLDN